MLWVLLTFIPQLFIFIYLLFKIVVDFLIPVYKNGKKNNTQKS